jgi:RNA polymerase sigma-70 factor (ECF subfamily)
MTDTLVDEETLSLARRGDPAAMERLLERLAPTLQRFARRLCGDGPDVDDTVQDAMLQIARKVHEFEGRSSLTSWSYAVARSACSHRRRGLKNRPPVADDAADERVSEHASPEATASDAELSRVLREVLDGLPEDYREVLVLRDVEGLTANEAASAVGLSVEALKSRLHRARGALREAMKPWLEPTPDESAPAACPDVATMLSRKIEGELTREDCASMEKHLEGCPRCKGACSALNRALSACARVRDDEGVPAAVQESVRKAMRAWLASAG